MSFSYDEELTGSRDRLRSYLDDAIENRGPYPGGRNFSDEQLDLYLSQAGGSLNGAFVICCRVLATAWSSHARMVQGTAMQVDARNVADEWRKRADEARKQPVDGSAGSTFRVFNAS